MKTNFQNDLVICFDLHDTLLDSRTAWLQTFKQICADDEKKFLCIKKEFLSKKWKRQICIDYGYDYDIVKEIYLSKVKPINAVKKFCAKMQNLHKVFVITNAKKYRAIEDINVLGLSFEKIYSRDDGIKPDNEYINKIMHENNIKYLLMVGNEKERDIFELPNTKTIIVNKYISYKKLMQNYNEICESLETL